MLGHPRRPAADARQEVEVKLSFHGAARGVTGSCHLIETLGTRILVDCGLYQGSRELQEENAAPFGFDAGAIDLLLLTHAHLDHCGRVALLAKRGFRGEIIATPATRELARLVMLDAAHLQEEEARRGARIAARRAGQPPAPGPLYSLLDALASLDLFGRNAAYGVPLALRPGLSATFLDAGHILGSAGILLEAEEPDGKRRVFFSGDIGNAGRPLLRAPVPPAEADAVVMETTYGDRLHRPIDASVEEFYQAVTETFARGGNVLIPTFALERAQEILYFLKKGIEASRLPPSTQVFLDSPMAISATEIFRRHPECFDAKITALFREGWDPFGLPGLHFARERAESAAINAVHGGAIIMAGSGMCTGGRIRHHLRHNLWRREAGVIFVGYASRGTPARQIIDGARQIRLFDEDIPVRAAIHTINGFSAHADQRELLAWHGRIGGAKRTFLVHGDEGVMQTFAGHLGQTQVDMPRPQEGFEI